MVPSDGEKEKEESRRSFLKWAGTLGVVSAVGLVGAATMGFLQKGPQAALESQTSTTTSTATETETITETATATNVATVTETATATTTTFSPYNNAAASTAFVPQGAVPAQNSFSIFWITDTQFLSETNPALYKLMNTWIVNNWQFYNGKLVIHTGDLVQTGDVQKEWQNANAAHVVFLENKIPYTWCAGNHDDYTQDIATSGWVGNIWGAPSFDPKTVKPWINSLGYTQWVDDYHAGMNTALTFTANGLKFLVINIEWNAGPEVLKWAQGILDNPAYAQYMAIVAPHAYIDAFGNNNSARWGTTLSKFVNGLVPILDSHPSVFLTLNGHFATDSGFNSPAPVNYRNELMFDRQDCMDDPGDPVGRGLDNVLSTTGDGEKVGGATVTILNFDTDNNRIHVSTYDVYTGQWRVDAANQYTIPLFPMAPAGTKVTVAPVATH